MAIKLDNGHVLCIVGVGIAALFIYKAYSDTDRTVQPHVETPVAFNAALDRCTQEEFFRPHLATDNQELGYTPHRYPSVTGGNISTLIHYGFSQLRLPAPQDRKWIERPPAEVMF